MRLLFSVLAIALVATLPVEAQQRPPAPPDRAEDDTAARFRLADSYLQAGQYDRAIALLEDLLEANPSSIAVMDRLKDAYIGAGMPEEAIGLLRQRIERDGPSANVLAEIGGLYFGEGDREAAEQAWRDAVRAAPDNVQTYRTLYSVLVRHRMWEKARDILLDGRARLRQPELFRMELAELYSRSNQHAEALEEWAGFLAESPNRMNIVQSRIGRMLDQEQAAGAFREALDRLIRRDPLELAYRQLAAWLAAETGDFASGLDHVRALDRLGNEQGESLLNYAEAALEAASYDVAGRAFELVLDLHPRSSAAAAAMISSALLHEQLGERAGERVTEDGSTAGAPNYAEAASRYRQFLDAYPASPAAPVALQRLAELKRDVFRDYDVARELLDQIVARFPGEHAVKARFALGELAILEDDLSAARIAFTRLENELRIGERAERARFNLAQVDFYQGNFEMALSRLNSLKRNTATDVANNAIDLKLTLTENQGPDSLATPLRTFARAELRIRQQRPTAALDDLDAILGSHAGHPITVLARFRRAETLRLLDRPEEALAILERLPNEHPDSYLADRALFLAAELRERDLQDPEAALQAYTQLLSRYPGSLLAPETRTRIRRLRGDRPS